VTQRSATQSDAAMNGDCVLGTGRKQVSSGDSDDERVAGPVAFAASDAFACRQPPARSGIAGITGDEKGGEGASSCKEWQPAKDTGSGS